MTTITSIALHRQSTTTALNITSSPTTIIGGLQRGFYKFILSQLNTYICTIELFLTINFAKCTKASNCLMNEDIFYNNVATCGLYTSTNTLQFQYSSNQLSVQTIDGTTLNNCTFITDYIGIDTPITGSSNISADFIQAGTGSVIGFKNDITGGNCTFTNFSNITSKTGSFQLNSVPVLTPEITDFVPIPINYTNTQTNSINVNNTYFGSVYNITKPVIYNKILCSVNQSIATNTGSSPRISIYQTTNGNSATTSNPANLISTATGILSSVGGNTDTNLTLVSTGTNLLVPGVAYFLSASDTGTTFTYYSYTNSTFRILNSNLITGAPTSFTTSISSLNPPSTFDPTSQTSSTSNVIPVYRLCA